MAEEGNTQQDQQAEAADTSQADAPAPGEVPEGSAHEPFTDDDGNPYPGTPEADVPKGTEQPGMPQPGQPSADEAASDS